MERVRTTRDSSRLLLAITPQRLAVWGRVWRLSFAAQTQFRLGFASAEGKGGESR